jgi:hypothetical protein
MHPNSLLLLLLMFRTKKTRKCFQGSKYYNHSTSPLQEGRKEGKKEALPLPQLHSPPHCVCVGTGQREREACDALLSQPVPYSEAYGTHGEPKP